MDLRHCMTCTCFEKSIVRNGYNFLVQEQMNRKEGGSGEVKNAVFEPKSVGNEENCNEGSPDGEHKTADNEADSDVEIIEEHHPVVDISSSEELEAPLERKTVIAISSDEENVEPTDDHDVGSSSESIISVGINPDEFKL